MAVPRHWDARWVQEHPGATLIQFRKLAADNERLRAALADIRELTRLDFQGSALRVLSEIDDLATAALDAR